MDLAFYFPFTIWRVQIHAALLYLLLGLILERTQIVYIFISRTFFLMCEKI